MSLNWESTVFTLIAFLILYFLLSKYAFKPLFSIMEKRKELVMGQMQDAEENRKQASQLLEDQKAALQAARKDAYDIIEQAKTTGSKQADELIATAKSESTRLKEEALRDIESEKNKAVAALRSQVSGMSVMIASKIIEKQIDEKSQEQLVAEYLKEVGDKA
ncbi:F0F1 ATP synthase subunit B [Paenibacillus guangzhouensis]|uniref:F0F1 ATP synthase subunit B n=1 Tax=Paenibacillus guangzhouensis TaxID=1473112 RepID=UPI001267592D|nr:F0F1 ATP synthase subunit B [Paenibacillus guangzhouensis]